VTCALLGQQASTAGLERDFRPILNGLSCLRSTFDTANAKMALFCHMNLDFVPEFVPPSSRIQRNLLNLQHAVVLTSKRCSPFKMTKKMNMKVSQLEFHFYSSNSSFELLQNYLQVKYPLGIGRNKKG